MTAIDHAACRSRLCGRSPGLKAAFSLITLLLCIAVDHWRFSAFVFFWMAFACIALSGITARAFLRLYGISFGFLLLGSLTMTMTYSAAPEGIWWFSWANGYMTVTYEGLARAAGLFMRSSACVSCITFLYVSTSVSQMIGLLGRLHCPAIFIELMLMTYRFIFILFEMAEQIRTAQRSRLGNNGYRTSLRSLGILGSSVFFRALKRSNETFNAMEARGYTGEFAYASALPSARAGEKWMLILYVSFLIVIARIVRQGA